MEDRLPERLVEELLRRRSRLPALLPATGQGLYALWLDEKAYSLLDVGRGLHGIAYIGIGAGNGGVRRRFEEEWRPSNSGKSTPRRTLGALLVEELGLRPKPRPTKTAIPNPRYYCFAGSGESDLTDWLEAHSHFAYVELPSNQLRGWGTLTEIERALIRRVGPPLNINGWDNPNRSILKAARQTASRLAERWPRSGNLGEE
jgi:hypothetical protein